MAEYHLLTLWRIEAPLEDVYAAIEDCLRWPYEWPGVHKLQQLAGGDAAGIDRVQRHARQGRSA